MNILITGGASGLGESITKTLAQDSNNSIFFTYSKSEENAKKIELEFDNTSCIKCDFSDPDEVIILLPKIKELDIDVLINNAYAGSFIDTYFHKKKIEDFESDFRNNTLPTIQITQSAISHFRRKKRGKIITILTSALTNTPPLGTSSYVANKAYLQSLVKSWASENIKFNITSNSVSPSFMQTSLTADVDERIIEQMESNHPLKKLLTVEEVSETVSYLTKASQHINGVDILLNSGENIA